MINKDNKVFIPDAEYGLSKINIKAVRFLLIALWFGILETPVFNNWCNWLNIALQIIVGVLLLVTLILACIFIMDKFENLLNRTGGKKLAIIDNKVYEFDIERVKGDDREALDVGKIKEIIDKAGNKQTAKDWIIENILKAIGREKSINFADITIPLPGETTVSTDENSEHLELTVDKCEILNIKISKHEDSIEVAYRYDFDDDDDIDDEDDIDDDDIDDDNNEPDGIIKYKPKNFVRFADGSLSGYKELIDRLESIQKQKQQE